MFASISSNTVFLPSVQGSDVLPGSSLSLSMGMSQQPGPSGLNFTSPSSSPLVGGQNIPSGREGDNSELMRILSQGDRRPSEEQGTLAHVNGNSMSSNLHTSIHDVMMM